MKATTAQTAQCISHPSEGGHPDDVCGWCSQCLACEGGNWENHRNATCADQAADAPRKAQPKPGTTAWLNQQRADREAREAAELRAFAKGGTQEEAAKAAVRTQRRREATRVVVGARVVTRNGQDAGTVRELRTDGRFWFALVALDVPYGQQTTVLHRRSFLVAS